MNSVFSFNKYKKYFFSFSAVGFCPKNNCFARVWRLQLPAPWLLRLCPSPVWRQFSEENLRISTNNLYCQKLVILDFLLVRHSNLGPISCTVSEIQRLGRVSRELQIFPTPLSFGTSLIMFPLGLRGEVNHEETIESWAILQQRRLHCHRLITLAQ